MLVLTSIVVQLKAINDVEGNYENKERKPLQIDGDVAAIAKQVVYHKKQSPMDGGLPYVSYLKADKTPASPEKQALIEPSKVLLAEEKSKSIYKALYSVCGRC